MICSILILVLSLKTKKLTEEQMSNDYEAHLPNHE
jgi:hypothetical protein